MHALAPTDSSARATARRVRLLSMRVPRVVPMCGSYLCAAMIVGAASSGCMVQPQVETELYEGRTSHGERVRIRVAKTQLRGSWDYMSLEIAFSAGNGSYLVLKVDCKCNPREFSLVSHDASGEEMPVPLVRVGVQPGPTAKADLPLLPGSE